MKKAQFLFTNHLQIGRDYCRSIGEFFDKFKYSFQPTGQSENYSLLPVFHLKLWLVACITCHLCAGRNNNVRNASQQSTENIPQVQICKWKLTQVKKHETSHK